MGVIVPEFVREILERFERQPGPFTEHDLASELKKARVEHREMTESEDLGTWAELAAFSFMGYTREENNPWDTYYGPGATGTEKDGKVVYYPDIAAVDRSIIDHWEQRAKEAKHPVMKARYADLVWDFSKVVAKKRPDIEFARTAIDCYVEAASGGLFELSVYGIQYLTRALGLAISVSDSTRVGKVRDAMFGFFDQHAEVTKPGTWAFLFENLWNNKKVPLTEAQAAKIIDSLEEFLRRSCDQGNKEEFDSWRAQIAAGMLEQHYRRENKIVEAERVIRAYGQAFESVAAVANPSLAVAWLQPVFDAYRSRGMAADAERVQLALMEKGKDLQRDMKAIEVPVSIPKEEVDAFLDALTDGGIEKALAKIVGRFIPKAQKAREQSEKSLSLAPLQALIPIIIHQGEMGHPVAKIGGVKDDPEGRLIYQLSQNVGFESPFLALALDKVRDRYTLTEEQLVEILLASPLFGEERRALILEGVSAYYVGDHVKALHILVPQIEQAMRRLLEALGVPANKAGKVIGTMQAKNLGDLLWEERIVEFVPEDLRLYLTAFLVDPRGHNLRNRLSHGLLTHQELRRPISDRVVHVLLCLALMFKKAGPKQEPPK